MLKLDHLTVIAPSLSEGAEHVRDCLGLDVPFGSRHEYMGTHNHRLRLGASTYLEIVALDPDGFDPGRARWFGVDDHRKVRADWDGGRRLRGWVASTQALGFILTQHAAIFGEEIPLPPEAPTFAFSIQKDGSLPLDGAAPSLIDHRGDSGYIATIPDLGARLAKFTLEHPAPEIIARLYLGLEIDRPPEVIRGPMVRYRAVIETPHGVKELT
ncbi:VOC family protein [Aliihoeflea sp. PC F10.4]